MANKPSTEYLAAVSNLMTKIRNLLDGLRLTPRTASATDSVLLALLSKSIVLTEAVVCLLSNGFTDEAVALSRSSMEIQITVRYMTNQNTVERCEKFYNFAAKDKTDWFRLIKQYYPDLQVRRRSDMEHLEKLAAIYRKPHSWSQHPEGLKGLAKEPDTFDVTEAGEQLNENFNYEVMYKLASQYVHSTVSAIDAGHVTPANELFIVHRAAGKSTMGDSALTSAYFAVHLNTIRVLRYLNMEGEYPEVLIQEFLQVAKME